MIEGKVLADSTFQLVRDPANDPRVRELLDRLEFSHMLGGKTANAQGDAVAGTSFGAYARIVNERLAGKALEISDSALGKSRANLAETPPDYVRTGLEEGGTIKGTGIAN